MAITDLAVFAGSLWLWIGSRPRRDRIVMGAGGALLVVGIILAALTLVPSANHTTALPPTPPSPSTTSGGAPAGTTTPPGTPRAGPQPSCKPGVRVTSFATPLRVCIPSIGVNASVIQLGLNADNTVQVPPLSQIADAGWYRYSPVPGAPGPTIILGHVDSAQYGRGVFFDLGRMRAGDRVSVTRSDGAVATYRITRVSEFAKSAFPTQLVYGNTPGPTVRLITCGGAFDASAGSYVDNIIAFGDLVSLSSV
ncbi:MAG: class F sortase [Actinomycetota bacterium]|nr:class F sortase [Actinomycetota bacterium]